MSLSRGSEQSITDQLSQAIRRMGDFLLKDSFDKFDEFEYEKLYKEIETLTAKANLEGYFNYKHKNKYKTLRSFLNNRNRKKLIKKCYSRQFAWSKVLKKQSIFQKTMKNGKKFIDWFVDKIHKINPFKINPFQ